MANKTPKYRRQKAPDGADRAFVQLGDRRVYLGTYGTPASREAYHRALAEWSSGTRSASAVQAITVVEVLDRFLDHAKRYYCHTDGTQTREYGCYQMALRPLLALYGGRPAAQFGPIALKAIRQWMIDHDWSHKYISNQVNRIRHVFKWAVAEELVPPAVYQGLQALPPLRRGRGGARQTEPVRPVPEAHVLAIREHVPPPVWAIIELQMLTGMRPSEVLTMRAIDLDTSGEVWTYRPTEHKNTWRGRERMVPLGPRSQAVIRPFLAGRAVDVPLFSPRDAIAWWHAQAPTHRHQPVKPPTTERRVRDRYDVGSYRRAIARACVKAGVPDWCPYRLRHSAATEIRRRHGLEAAQVLLGHAKMDVTQVYAEANVAKAIEIARNAG